MKRYAFFSVGTFLLFFIFLYQSFFELQAATFTVQNGQSIQAAIDGAQNGDKIIVLGGTYTEALSLRGKNIKLMGKNNPVLDGQNNHRILYMDNQIGSYFITHQTKIKGFIFRQARINKSQGIGAAVLITNGASPQFTKCVFERNYSALDGGAVAILEESRAYFESCAFDYNQSYRMGGAILNYNASPIFKKCVFTNNTASGKIYQVDSLQNANGGAINSGGAASYVKIVECKFEGNLANLLGGAIVFSSHGGLIKNCVITNNVARWHGGAITINGTGQDEGIEDKNVKTETSSDFKLTSSTLVKIKNNTISNNVSNILAGGIHVESGNVEIQDNVISGNAVIFSEEVFNEYPFPNPQLIGGGIYCYNSYGVITGNVISNNVADKTAAMSLENGPVLKYGPDYLMINNRIENNFANDAYPGVTLVHISNEFFKSAEFTLVDLRQNTFTHNICASTANGDGVALAIFNVEGVIFNNTFNGNSDTYEVFIDGGAEIFDNIM